MGASPLGFGPLTANATFDAQTTINVTCTSGGAYSVALDLGSSGQGTLELTGVSDSSHLLPYALYKDSSHSQPWNTANAQDSAGNGSLQTMTVFGRLITGSSPVADTYADTVTVTITY
jgi:spore coat protein U-like protein